MSKTRKLFTDWIETVLGATFRAALIFGIITDLARCKIEAKRRILNG